MKRPPKKWFDKCTASVARDGDADDPRKLCGWIWYHQMSERAKRKAVRKEGSSLIQTAISHLLSEREE